MRYIHFVRNKKNCEYKLCKLHNISPFKLKFAMRQIIALAMGCRHAQSYNHANLGKKEFEQ